MRKILFCIIILLTALNSLTLSAQNTELKAGLRAGHNTVFGGFAAMSVEAIQTVLDNFSVSGGLQYNTIGRTALEARSAYHMTFDWGKLSPEVLLEYTNLSSINSFVAGVGASLDFESISARLGYYYRLYGGKGGSISEPFNIYYEFRAHFLRKLEKWILDLVITNCEIFELERHYQPSYIAEACFNPTSRMGISFGIGCKPSGTFHLSVDNYQSYIKTGVCYRW